MGKIMISCDEATKLSDKDQYEKLSLSDRFKLNLHLMMCKHCNAYAMQNNYMTKLLGKYLDKSCEHDHLADREKKELEEKLKVRIREVSKKQ
jgi:predicted AAA+ superfamily ATPase